MPHAGCPAFAARSVGLCCLGGSVSLHSPLGRLASAGSAGRWKVQSASFFRLLFPNTFWITKTYIVLYFPKPWTIKSKVYLPPCFRAFAARSVGPCWLGGSLENPVSQFVPVIVSKHILGHENIYCFIFSQALHLILPRTCLHPLKEPQK